MSEEYNEDAEDDLLATLAETDLSEVPHERLLLRGNQLVEVEVEKCEVAIKNRDDGTTSKNIAVTLKTLKEYPAVKDGFECPENMYIFHNISIVPTDKYTIKSIQQNMAAFQMCFRGVKGRFGDPAEYVGLTGMVKVGYRDDPTYGESNPIQKFIPKS